MIKTDCFAYRTDPVRCTALKELYCRCEECHFYKPSEYRIESNPPSQNRGSKLTPQEVAYIRNNYVARHPNLGLDGMAKKFNMSKKAISSILQNKSWREE